MNRFILGSLWFNGGPSSDIIGMDAWMQHYCAEKFQWLIDNANRDWEYELILDHYEADMGQGLFNVYVVFDNLDDALFYKLRWG
jgi:hypothetical protein